MPNMVRCKECGRYFKDKRGLNGHYRFYHGIELSTGRPATKTRGTEKMRKIIERERKGRSIAKDYDEGRIDIVERKDKGYYSRRWRRFEEW